MLPGDAPSFSIVVPTFRRPAALERTLAALLSLDYPQDRYEVIVVDDEGKGTGAEVVAGLDRGGIRIELQAQTRLGAASARNRGAQCGQGELLLFVDDDIMVAPDHLQRHVRTRARHGDPLVNGAWEFTPEVREALARTPFGRYRLDLEQHFRDEAVGRPLDGQCVEM